MKRDEEFYKKEIRLMKDIDWVCFISEKIDKENSQLLEKVQKLRLENFVDESEKKFLIE